MQADEIVHGVTFFLRLGFIILALFFSPFVAFPRLFAVMSVRELPMKDIVKQSDFDRRDLDYSSQPKGTCDSIVTPFRTFWRCLRHAMTFGDFRIVATVWFLCAMASSFLTTNYVFLLTKYYFVKKSEKKMIKWVLLGKNLTNLLALPLLWVLMKFISKKKAFYLMTGVTVAISLSLFFLPNDLPPMLTVCLLSLNGVILSLGALVQTMMPDTVQAYCNKFPLEDDKVCCACAQISIRFFFSPLSHNDLRQRFTASRS